VELLRLICRDRQLDQEFARGFSQVRDSFPEFCDTFGDLGLPGGHNPHRKSVITEKYTRTLCGTGHMASRWGNPHLDRLVAGGALEEETLRLMQMSGNAVFEQARTIGLDSLLVALCEEVATQTLLLKDSAGDAAVEAVDQVTRPLRGWRHGWP